MFEANSCGILSAIHEMQTLIKGDRSSPEEQGQVTKE
jgi:hypothetical protein